MASTVGANRAQSTSWSYHDSTGLEELRGDSIRIILIALIVLAWGILAVMAAVIRRADAQGFFFVACLLGTAAVTNRALPYSARLAAGALIAGLIASAAASLVFYPSGETAPLFALVILLSTSLIGWQLGLVAAGIGTATLLAIFGVPWVNPIPPSGMFADICLMWATAFLAWILSRPFQAALDWSWNSYMQFLQKTEELRDRQGELVRLSTSLNVALDRLENLTEELERARRTAEDAREAKTQFAIAVSHELRTPLNLVIGFSEMMVLTPESSYGERLPDSYRGDLEAIYCNACHISNLIDDVLDLSQVEAHRMALQKEAASLTAVIEEATTAVRTMIRDKRLRLEVTLPPELPSIQIDPVRIRQVLINLLVNATRYTERGGITISVTANDADLIVAVRDTGIGIPPKDLPRIFEDFWQVRRSTFRQGGSGIGLAVSRRLIELHGGNIWVTSQPGEGSTFFFSLPRRGTAITTSLEADWKSRASAVIRSGFTPTLLLIDGEGEMSRIFQRYFDGYRVIGAANLEKANQALQDVAVHALVVDSPEAGRSWLSLQRSKAAGPKLVAVCPFRTQRERVSELGVADYLVKPIRRERLRKALRKIGRKLPQSLLVVDDDTEMLRLLTRTVQSFGAIRQIWSAHDGYQALEILRDHRVDAVLLDLVMPRLDGYGLLAAMRGDAAMRGISVIVMTGWEAQEKTVTAQSLAITSADGLTVGETVRCLRGALDSLLIQPPDNAPTSPAGLSG